MNLNANLVSKGDILILEIPIDYNIFVRRYCNWVFFTLPFNIYPLIQKFTVLSRDNPFKLGLGSALERNELHTTRYLQ